jgi:hypothetical protein
MQKIFVSTLLILGLASGSAVACVKSASAAACASKSVAQVAEQKTCPYATQAANGGMKVVQTSYETTKPACTQKCDMAAKAGAAALGFGLVLGLAVVTRKL